MKKLKQIFGGIFLVTFLLGGIAEARVGGGRSFGSRGSRGFSAPRGSYGSPYRSSGPSTYQNPYSSQQNSSPFSNSVRPSTPSTGSTFLKSLGAGIAGGMIGSMISRAFFGGSGVGYGSGMGGGFGFLEILLLGGLLYFLFRMFTTRSQPTTSSDGAAALMRKARPMGWAENPQPDYYSGSSSSAGSQLDMHMLDSTPVNPEQAMDLFFKIQGAWANRDLSSVHGLLDRDAKDYLENELSRLKSARRINRLENIAVRNTDVVETWRDSDREYSTVRILASLLDYTVDENTQQIVEGSKSDPVKFEEYWTFSREVGTSSWKLSAIQQN